MLTRTHVAAHADQLVDLWTSSDPGPDRIKVQQVIQDAEPNYSRALCAYVLLRLEDRGHYIAAERFFAMLCSHAGIHGG